MTPGATSAMRRGPAWARAALDDVVDGVQDLELHDVDPHVEEDGVPELHPVVLTTRGIVKELLNHVHPFFNVFTH